MNNETKLEALLARHRVAKDKCLEIQERRQKGAAGIAVDRDPDAKEWQDVNMRALYIADVIADALSRDMPQLLANLAAEKARADKAEEELDAIRGCCDTRCMDPPDGGDPSTLEMVRSLRQMRDAAEKERDALLFALEKIESNLRHKSETVAYQVAKDALDRSYKRLDAQEGEG